MKITDIAHKIENPDFCSSSDVSELEELVNKYPYAQTFPILLLKTLGQSKDVHFEDALNKYAYRISDRMHLYYLVNDKDEVAVPEIIESHAQEKFNNSPELKEEIIPAEASVIEDVVAAEPVNSVLEEVQEEFSVSIEIKEEVLSDVDNTLETSTEERTKSEDENVVRLDYEKLLEEDIKFAKVEEMSFEPVRIHITETGDVTGVNSETNEKIVEDKIEEIIETAEKPELSSEKITIEEEEINIKEQDHLIQNEEDDSLNITISEEAEMIQEKETESNEVFEEEEIVTAEKADEDSVEFDLEDEDDMYEEVIEEPQAGSMEFFDPTEELKVTNSVEDISILEPSSFEEQKKTISLDLISKKFNPADDELTSNAISQGFHITLDSEEEIKKQEETKSNISHSIEQFEQNKQDEKRSFYSWLHANEKVKDTPEKIGRSSQIIEKFIKEDPKISRSVKEVPTEVKKKVPFFKATEVAKESLMENVIPVSATLAQIFEAQGNFPKAIHTYEQLLLLYPEKKTFFANQIKNLKKKLNN